MRELHGRSLPTRVKGQRAIARRLHGVVKALWRYGQHRASTTEERRWTARLLDSIEPAWRRANDELTGQGLTTEARDGGRP